MKHWDELTPVEVYALARLRTEVFLREQGCTEEELDWRDLEATTEHYLLPAEEYAAGHLPGAVSIPFPEFADRIDEVPADRPVALYCRGELCRRAREAASLLRSNGVDARAMESGVVEWRAAGNWPVSLSGHGATGATSTD
ncbi:hypothetical protein CVAR_0342 [Corynebacterium variabile DSM 44702]|uniref:Rhodanese domain-containing protein n=1 Tax=Corynebacterium variabile (strain DSM 44702 / CIP 107183 / JCM 12073 / NCIMB 30131) TaxID=858619 RepID=G0H9Y6_CORVD|nr:hypothetical protein CVAR_0342 [Corynebacterium variabile DSM 44702]